MDFTDKTKMPYGKYKGADMEDVPADYLLWLHEKLKPKEDALKFPDDEILAYIEDNMQVLKEEAKNYPKTNYKND